MRSLSNTCSHRFMNRMFMIIILLLSGFYGFSQNVGINTTGAAPNTSAGLDVDFTDKGVLIPRVALTSTTSFAPLAAHVAGMVVYNTATAGNVTPGFYYNNGSGWIPSFPSGTAVGNLLYWDGSAWVMVPVGTPGQYLILNGSQIPTWGGNFSSLTTTAVSGISDILATSGGNITSEGGSAILSRGVCWSTSPAPTIGNTKTVDGAGAGIFTSILTGLVQSTIYYVRAYAINGTSISYGNEISFTTATPTTPVLLDTESATSITATTATSGGNLTSSGNATILARGICYSTVSPPTIADTKVVDPGTGLGAFSSNLTGLTSNTVYYIRSYATNSSFTGYGTVTSFTTLPVVSATAIASAITTTGATSGGTITVGGGASITARGVCWSTTLNPVLGASNFTSDATGTGAFTSTITGLAYTTLYHVRAYATNASGTVYGPDITFTTLTPVVPTLAATTAASAITGSTATSGGNVTSDGGAPITERGLVWSTTTTPTTASAGKVFVSNPSPGTGIFTGSITGLTGGTLYYVRAYAINSAGTAYGTQISFTSVRTPPTLFTVAATNISGGSATSGGSMNWNGPGYSNYQNYGVCYSTSPGSATPTYVNTNTTNYSWTIPIAPWTTNITGLVSNTTYYIRSFLYVFTGGTPTWSYFYGPELSFTTSAPTAPVVASTNAVTAILSTTATSGGVITSDGGSAITAKGVCWGYTDNPVLGASNFTSNGTGTASFISSLTGLTGVTTYYVRAYATNAIGTTYAPTSVSFTTNVQSLYTLGQNVGYGWVAYIDPATGGGFIVGPDISPVSPATSFIWGCSGTHVAVGTALGTGQANTNLIIASCPGVTAASTANDYTVTYSGTTYSNWYLPSSSEWNYIAAIYNFAGISGLGNFFTSSEYGTNYNYASTYFVNSGNNYSSGAARTNGQFTTRIRAIMDFGPAPAVIPTVIQTNSVTSIVATGGTSGGSIASNGGAAITAKGVCWSTSANPTIANSKTTDGTGNTAFTSVMTAMSTGTTYHVRAYATNSAGTAYGNDITFTPTGPGFPSVTTTALSLQTGTGATSGGTIVSDGGVAITANGVCWATTSTPTIADSKTTDAIGTPTFTSAITGLTAGTTYYIRAYATNVTGTSYGNELTYIPLSAPVLTTTAITNITGNSVTSGGNISSDGGSAVTARGVCWSTVSNPTTADFTLVDATGGTGVYVSNITGLTAGSTYFVRAYATNGIGTSYGNEEIVVPMGPATPTLTTDPVTSPSSTGGTSGGNITSDGGLTVTARGVCWSNLNYPPTIADSKTVDGGGAGTFTSTISGLTAGSGYWIAAYATNSLGTSYGQIEYYMPVGPPNIGPGQLFYWAGDPQVQIGLNIINDGGSAFTAVGAVWNTSPNPTVEVNGGISTELLSPMPSTAVILPIVQLTTYYIRAYATNSIGTSYSPEIVFTPGVLSIPTITTDPIVNKIGAIAEGGATVLSDGGDLLISAGLCWSTSVDPTVDVNLGMSTDGFTGQFYSLMTGLTVGTTYHVRGYATNSTGTGYGADLTFTATAATIGQVITGGLMSGTVFSVDGTGNHGLIADPWGWGTSDWGCTPSVTGATGTALGTGQANTAAINADITTNLCTSASVNGAFASEIAMWNGIDWYLPSKDEVTLLWTNRVSAGLDATLTPAVPIWSSSEVNATNAWYFDGTTWLNTGDKTAQYTVWPIRSF